MEFNEAYRERIDSALERVEETASDGRNLSRSERIEHVTALLGWCIFSTVSSATSPLSQVNGRRFELR